MQISINDLAGMLANFTNENYAKKDFQQFYYLLHQISLRGMGIGMGWDVNNSGEDGAMAFVRQSLERKYPQGNWVVFDVGANVGQFVSAASRMFPPDKRRIFSFEPSSHAFAKLQAVVAGIPGASAFNFGFGDAEGKMPIFADTAGSAVGSLYKRELDHINTAMNRIEEVSIRTIDRFAAEQSIERIHFLKIDTEGHELKCMEGARGLIDSGRIDFIQFEFGCNVDSRTYFRDFWHMLKNYKIKRILRDGFHDIERYQEAEEIFLNQNFLACPRV